jgi:hypothetical protein
MAENSTSHGAVMSIILVIALGKQRSVVSGAAKQGEVSKFI